jgi:hypothetical protein
MVYILSLFLFSILSAGIYYWRRPIVEEKFRTHNIQPFRVKNKILSVFLISLPFVALDLFMNRANNLKVHLMYACAIVVSAGLKLYNSNRSK